MSDPTFSVIDDRTGAVEDATLQDLPEYQAKGYRIVHPAAYGAARFVAADPAPEPNPAPGEEPMRQRGEADAQSFAEETYPDAKAAPADKRPPKRTVA